MNLKNDYFDDFSEEQIRIERKKWLELGSTNWPSFKKKYLSNLDAVPQYIEYFLLDEDIKNYIFENDKDKLLSQIANSSSGELRDFYFSEDNIKILIEKEKFAYNLLYATNFIPNKRKLLKKEYFLRALTQKKYFLPATIEYIIKEINKNENLKTLEVDKKYAIVIELFDYYLKDIDSNINLFDSMFKKIPLDLYEYIIKAHSEQLKKHEKKAPTNFSYNCFFKEYGRKILIYHKSTCLNDIFEMIELFNESPRISSCFGFVSAVLDNIPDEINTEYGKKKLSMLSAYRERINIYLKRTDVKYEVLNNIVDNYGWVFNKIQIICGNDTIKHYLDKEGIKILAKTKNLPKLFESDINIDFLLEDEEFAKILSEQSFSKKELDEYLTKIKKSTSIESIKNY